MVKKKVDFRERADVAAAYGLSRIDDYETLCGLWANMPRIRWQRAAEVMLGVSYALSGKRLPVELFDALARFESEIGPMEFEVNAERATQQTMAKTGRI